MFVTGCASERVAGIQRRAGVAQQSHAGAAASAPACAFTLNGIDDQRAIKGLGHMGITQIDGEGFSEWFAQGIASIPGYGRDAAAPAIRVAVLKAYVHGLGTMKSANLVVRVQFLSEGAAPAVHTYRGFDDTINWSTSEGEIQAALDRALVDLTAQIGADLKKRCKG